MPSHTETKTLPFSAKQMFDLVMDIEKYPEFLPWCLASKITKTSSENSLEADLVINFKGFTQKYSSNVRTSKIYAPSSFADANSLPLNRGSIDNELLISVAAIDGPFKNLINAWEFKDISGGCKVKFFIDFEFKSMILGKMIGMIFQKATNKMIDAFESRAHSIYK
ncbi:MAG: coenzyme Q-binding protein COQ10 [Myxococcota bacterium]